jgi:hypothetical protein
VKPRVRWRRRPDPDADLPAEHIDVLSTGPTEDRSRVPQGIALIVGVVVVVAFAAAAGDRALRHREFISLSSAANDAQTTATHADAQMLSTRQYTMPLLGSAPANVRAGLEQLIAQSAGQGATAVRATRAKLASTSVLPWHPALRKAKKAELAYLDSWTAYLESVARSGDVGTMPTRQLDVDLTTATTALQHAA